MRILAALFACASLVACDPSQSTDGGVPSDAGTDASTLPVDIPWLDRGLPDVMLTPCPDGWREVVDPDGITVCDAYPAAGPAECPLGEAHFPGEPACRPIGSPCPTGDWPDGLPSDESTVVFVRPGATAGDGSRAAPFGTLGEVPWSLRGPGWTIALAKGRHEGTIPMRAGVRVVGACTAETLLTTSSTESDALVEVRGPGPMSELANLAIIDAPVRGVDVAAGGSLTLTGVLVVNATQVGVYLNGAGTIGEAADLVVTGTRPRSDGYFGYGISVENGPRFTGARIVLADNHDISLFSEINDADVAITDTAIYGTNPRRIDGTGGRAINVQNTASLNAERLWLRGNRDVTLLIANASATVSDVVVSDTSPIESDGTDGRGIGIQEGATFSGTRVAVSNSRDVGISIGHPGTVATLVDVVVRDTAAQESDGRYGRAINVQDGARLDATRLVVSRSRDVGVFAIDGAVVTLTDVAVRDTEAETSDMERGAGVSAQSGSTIEATRLLVVSSRETGIEATGGTFHGRDVVVEDTQRAACDCPERVLGYGASVGGGIMTLDGFRISRSATCGLFVADQGGGSGSLDVTRGVVEAGAIGACVQVPGYDLGRLSGDVAFIDNETSLDSTTLPVPEPIDGV